jgi:hypothetical protein
MTYSLSLQTCFALKNKNFPQPEPEWGQMWWYSKGGYSGLFVISEIRKEDDGTFDVWAYFEDGRLKIFSSHEFKKSEDLAYHPQTDDFLKLLVASVKGVQDRFQADFYENSVLKRTGFSHSSVSALASLWIK